MKPAFLYLSIRPTILLSETMRSSVKFSLTFRKCNYDEAFIATSYPTTAREEAIKARNIAHPSVNTATAAECHFRVFFYGFRLIFYEKDCRSGARLQNNAFGNVYSFLNLCASNFTDEVNSVTFKRAIKTFKLCSTILVADLFA